MLKVFTKHQIMRAYWNNSPEDGHISFYCPACECEHTIRIKPVGAWDFCNNDLEKPTFRESVLVRSGIYVPGYSETLTPEEIGERREHSVQCHSYITDGFIAYATDSIHPGKDFRGQTIELPNKY
jgi:hypothetical protein